jgi:uncharacterized protein
VSGGNWKEMFHAACEGDLDLVEYHVKQGIDINYAHPEFLSTPLVACILARQEEVARYLLSKGASPHLHSEFDGVAPHQAATQAGLVRVAATLIQLGAVPKPSPPAPRGWFTRLRMRAT